MYDVVEEEACVVECVEGGGEGLVDGGGEVGGVFPVESLVAFFEARIEWIIIIHILIVIVIVIVGR